MLQKGGSYVNLDSIKEKIIPGKYKYMLTSKMRRKEALAGYLFLSPWIIGFIFITGGPIIATFILAFTEYNLVDAPSFIGFSNFIKMFNTSLFWQSIKVTAIYTAGILPLVVVISLVCAVILNQKIVGKNLFRSLFYLPSVLPLVATALVFAWVLNPNFGIINYVLRILGLYTPSWLNSETWVIPAFWIITVWRMIGPPMIIFLAALQGIPERYYEAARIDGASALQQAIHITLPQISPMILYVIILNLVQSWQVFTPTFVLTQGGPNYGSFFYVYYLYNSAFQKLELGYASALALLFFIILLIITIILLKTSSLYVYYESQVKG